MPPPRDTGGIGGDVLKALVGTDAVAYAAGAGQIPGRDTALEGAGILRDSGTTLESVVEGLHAVGLNDGRPQVSVPAGGGTLSEPRRALTPREWEARGGSWGGGVKLLTLMGKPLLRVMEASAISARFVYA